MSIFQKSVIQKYLQTLDETIVISAYQTFQKFYGNQTRLQNIERLKEESFQEGFLREIFVQVLGYTINPDPAYNLTTEFKNQTDSKKADGAILKDGKAIGVIELKSTKTTDLESIRQQAFNYKNNQPECKYIITSNFRLLRFYVDNATEYEEFNLFSLSQAEFRKFFLILNREHLLAEMPSKLKAETKFHEENISAQFYKDYSTFKNKIFNNLVNNNPQFDKLTLFKKSQKLLDRLLFTFFAEDRGLIPPNAINRIIEQWQHLKDLEAYQPLYDRYKKFFEHLNKGHKYQNYELPEYNGGLFAPDEILDNSQIEDEILVTDSLKLSQYDFSTEIDVNILGHIFEHSLAEIEEITAELAGAPVEKQKSKRKKDGIYYTPKYITRYIVENTVGALCRKKKETLEILNVTPDETHRKADGKISKKGEALYHQLEAYKAWLLSLKIVDPACGSGAFLNQALEFLIEEHRQNDALLNELANQPLGLFNTDKEILENNLFGVDLNEESVEIARLSLWLRTARKGRKLSMLNNNIKCGNSLIDDPQVAGDKAFSWEKEFPEIMANGGFDVVIGNPPYVHLEKITNISEALAKKGYQTYHKRGDLYSIFVEKGFEILKQGKIISYIMSNKWLQAGYGKPLREYLLNKKLVRLIDFGDIQIFPGATTYPCIFVAEKSLPGKQFSVSVLNESNMLDFDYSVSKINEIFETKSFNGDTWVISSNKDYNLLRRINGTCTPLSQFVNGEAYYGIKFGLTEAFLISSDVKNILINKDPNSKNIIGSILRGRDLKRYEKPDPQQIDYIILASFGSYKYLKIEYPVIYEHLLQFENKLKSRGQCRGSKKTGEKPFEGQHHWLELDNNPSNSYLETYAKPKIMYQKFQVKPCFIYDEQGLYCNDSMWIIPTKNKALLGILNSKMGWWLITKYCTQIQNGYQLIWKYFGQIPIPDISQISLDILVEKILELTGQQQKIRSNFLKYLSSQHCGNKFSDKLRNWSELGFGEFINEINGIIKKSGCNKLNKSQELEWMEIFEKQKSETQYLKHEITKTDREIDQLVYQLYGLTSEEIEIVENSVK